MEPLSAVAVATSVAQFIDFASKVIAQTTRLYRAQPDDETGEHYHLERITHNFQKYKNDLKEILQEQSSHQLSLSTDDQEIVRLCADCEAITSKLLSALERLRSSKRTFWYCFLDALKTVWSNPEVHSLRQTLEAYRQQISLYLLSSLRGQILLSQKSHSNQQEELCPLLKQTRTMVKGVLEKLTEEQLWRQDIIQAIHNDYERTREITKGLHSSPAIGMKEILTIQNRQHFNKGLLSWLRFTELNYRNERIDQAYKDTYEWIFRVPAGKQWSDFAKWLCDDSEPLYWITGKPAAGKSTLMKFIYNHPSSAKLFKNWAQGKKLIKSAFYFWNSGSELQMSEEGMARTLLYEALRAEPDLWEIVFPHKMEEYIIFEDPWSQQITWSEIMQAFRRLVQNAGGKYKLFFFIDGLDEFNGDHEKLIAMIQGLLSLNVKTCVSSRPWMVFEDGFHQRPSLRLEDLTYQDIKHYVKSRLSQNRGFKQWKLLDPKYASRLIGNVVQKASGVFLWVHLVTDSLLQGLSKGERLEELQLRLDALPPDLEHLFWKILSGLDSNNIKRACEFFQLYRRCFKRPTLLMLSYADECGQDVALEVPVKTPSIIQSNARADIMRRRLITCCQGLLEAKPVNTTPLFKIEVEYLHRTVKDYVERPEVWSKFLSVPDQEFNPYARWCNERIIKLRTSKALFFKWANEFWSIVREAIEYALLADPKATKGLQVKFFRALDITAAHLASPKVEESTSSRQPNVRKLKELPISWTGARFGCALNRSFLHLAIQSCLFEFVQEVTLQPSGFDQEELSQGLLVAVLQHRLNFGLRLKPDTRMPADIMGLLLSRGADPNLPIQDALKQASGATGAFSPWQAFLRMLKKNPDLTLQLPSHTPPPCSACSLPRVDVREGWDTKVDHRPSDAPFKADLDEEWEGWDTRVDHRPSDAPFKEDLDEEYDCAKPSHCYGYYHVDTRDQTSYQNVAESDPAKYLRECSYSSQSLIDIMKLFLHHGADPSLVRKHHGDVAWSLAKKKLNERKAWGWMRSSAMFKLGKG